MTLALVAPGDPSIPTPALASGSGASTWPPARLPDGLTAADAERIAAAISAGRTESTRKTYASAWRRFERWCADRVITGLPATPTAICAYLTEFAETGVVSGTIEGACAAIADAHRSAGLGNPVADETVKQVRRGIRRTLGTAPRRQARPLSTAEIRQILAAIDRISPKGIRDAAIICSASPPHCAAPNWPP